MLQGGMYLHMTLVSTIYLNQWAQEKSASYCKLNTCLLTGLAYSNIFVQLRSEKHVSLKKDMHSNWTNNIFGEDAYFSIFQATVDQYLKSKRKVVNQLSWQKLFCHDVQDGGSTIQQSTAWLFDDLITKIEGLFTV